MALFKRKDKDGKRKGENAIGKIIYGFLLFMPLIAVGVACLYTIINKNAFESYTKDTIKQSVKINDVTQIQQGVNYNISYKENVNNTTLININYISLTKEELNLSQQNYDKISSIAFYTSNAMEIRYTGGYVPYTWQRGTNFNIITTSNSGYQNLIIFSYITQTTLVSNTLDNTFYIQLNKLEESDLFNWTKNTGAYTVMHNVTSGIGITNTYTPMLMTYWLLISVIYFIFDIALILVWTVHDKIHELKDAI